MNIVSLAHNLKMGDDEIWMSAESSNVSYPEGGHARNLLIEDESFWFRHRNECIVAAVKNFSPNESILDVGGGNGFVARRLLDEGFDCTLLEPGVAGALNAKRIRGIPQVIRSTLESAQFEHGRLSAIGMFDVIEHISDDNAMIDEVYNLLQHNGLFYCTVPMYRWLWSKHDVTAGHFRRYTRCGLEKLLQGRFKILYFSHLFSVLVLPMFVLKVLPYRVLGKGSMLKPEEEHVKENQFAGLILRKMLEREVIRIANKKNNPRGTSGIVVAQKI